jgi:cell division septation protein DedD
MAEREPQFVTMSRQGIFVATVMGVGLLTLCYVIGVQVGKRSLDQSSARAKTLDEELNELPEPLDEQLKLFRSIESGNSQQRSERPRQDPARQEPARQETARQETAPANRHGQAQASRQEPPAAAPMKQPTSPKAPKAAAGAEMYTAQVIATGSPDTAKRISEQLKAAGMPAKVVLANGLYKVQMDWSLPRAEMESRLPRLRALGFSPVAVRLQ